MEKWKDIPGYEGFYQVSNMGNIKSVDRRVSDGRLLKGRNIKPWRHTEGYRMVSLSKNGKVIKMKISRLVLLAFVRTTDFCILQVRHLNAKRDDDRLLNLKYGMQADNENDKISLNLDNAGERNGMSKLTVSQVREIKNLIAKKLTYKEISKNYPIKPRSISDIACGRTWRNV